MAVGLSGSKDWIVALGSMTGCAHWWCDHRWCDHRWCDHRWCGHRRCGHRWCGHRRCGAHCWCAHCLNHRTSDSRQALHPERLRLGMLPYQLRPRLHSHPPPADSPETPEMDPPHCTRLQWTLLQAPWRIKNRQGEEKTTFPGKYRNCHASCRKSFSYEFLRGLQDQQQTVLSCPREFSIWTWVQRPNLHTCSQAVSLTLCQTFECLDADSHRSAQSLPWKMCERTSVNCSSTQSNADDAALDLGLLDDNGSASQLRTNSKNRLDILFWLEILAQGPWLTAWHGSTLWQKSCWQRAVLDSSMGKPAGFKQLLICKRNPCQFLQLAHGTSSRALRGWCKTISELSQCLSYSSVVARVNGSTAWIRSSICPSIMQVALQAATWSGLGPMRRASKHRRMVLWLVVQKETQLQRKEIQWWTLGKVQGPGTVTLNHHNATDKQGWN